MKIKVTFADQGSIEKIHEKSIYILENIGVIMQSKQACDIFRQHGAKVDGEIVYITRKMVEDALKTCQSTFEWYGRGNTLTVGGGESLVFPSYGPNYVVENNVMRKPDITDFKNFHRLHETSDVLHGGTPYILEPWEVPSDIRNNYRMATTLKYHTKPVMGMTAGAKSSKDAIDMTKAFYGVEDKVVLLGLINATDPMSYPRDMVESLVEYAMHGQAILLTAGGILGLSTPSSLVGSFTVNNAATLAGVVLIQLINPGNPVIYGCQGSSSNLTEITLAYGNFATAKSIHLTKAVANYYGLPSRSGGSINDAKEVDYQAGAETYSNLFASLSSGSDFFIMGAGILDTVNAVGTEKYILDELLIKGILTQLNDTSVDEESFLMKDIEKAGPGGNYINRRTSKYYKKEFYLNPAFNNCNTNNWVEGGSPTVMEKAHKLYLERLKNFSDPENTPEQIRLLDRYIPKEYS
ncbi:trimethylamine methyltransferase family protein [Alkalibacter saccharofermentans]|uniref:Trimethylamine---corrinoid protein Co-methyltransferase n=1 Tax=Alkalibacter saccharofermentans DSM 14828 TaxID=1120975 RepID=A0A1M4ZNC6_9FIRM|nr:trimethylamine methyltransferase family protein [Alkalibacter saccharofermentans]SHF19511.1 trimethylamine---corrinoid protein Co-methyltransferase [Alkalibacter saccharofermentans DSM 14828]